MKRIATALAMCLLLTAAGSAYAQQETFTWTGASSTAWNTFGNWSGPANEYPGQDDTDDIVYIDSDLNSTQPGYSTGTVTVDTIDIDAHANGYTVELTVSGGTLNTGGLVLVKGKLAAPNKTATISVTGGTFAPNSMEFYGRNHATAGHAFGDFDVDVTVRGAADGTVDTTIKGYVDFDIDDSTTVYLKDVVMDSNGADWEITGHSNTGVSRLCMYTYADNDQPVSFIGPLRIEVGGCP